MKMDPKLNKRIWSSLIMMMWSVIFALAMFADEIGGIEGRLNPVIRDFRITSIQETEDGATVIRAEGIKVRNCALRGVDWSLIEDDLESAVGFNNREIQRVNPPGKLKMGPWTVYASKDQILESGRVVMVHRCHFAFRTRTPVYQGTDR